ARLLRRRHRCRRTARLGTVTRERARSLAGQACVRHERLGRHPVSRDDDRRDFLEIAVSRRIAIGVTGASGAIYGLRTIAALLDAGCRLEIVFSEYGRRLLLDEVAEDAKVDRLVDILAARYGEGVRRGTVVVHSNKDLGSALASGSHQCEAMAI